MTSRERTLAACAFRRPDRIPRFDNFQEYTKEWESRFGPAVSLVDMEIIVPDETPFPSRARRTREEAGWIYEVDGWGRTLRRRPDAFFVEVLRTPIPAGADPDSVRFDSPGLDARYAVKSLEEIGRLKRQRALFAKTGGPFLRTSFVRGETQFRSTSPAIRRWPLRWPARSPITSPPSESRRSRATACRKPGSGFTTTWGTTTGRCSARNRSSAFCCPRFAG